MEESGKLSASSSTSCSDSSKLKTRLSVRLFKQGSEPQFSLMYQYSPSVNEENSTFIECCEFTPDENSIIFCGGDGQLRQLDLSTGKIITQILAHEDVIWHCSVSRNNNFVATCSSDRTVKVWERKANQLRLYNTLEQHADTVWSCQFESSSKYIISCSSDKSIIIWKFQVESESIKFLRGHTSVVENIAISPSGKLLASCSRDKTIRIWDNFIGTESEATTLTTDRQIHIPKIIFDDGHKDRIVCCSFPPHRDDIISSSSADDTVIVWNVTEQEIMWIFYGHTNIVWSCCFLRRKTELMLLSCSNDHSLRYV